MHETHTVVEAGRKAVERRAEERPKGSFYAVVQYIPDPVADEKVNVGVLAFGDGRVRARFIGNWSRAVQLSGQRDVSFLQEAASALAAATEDEIRATERSWPAVLQLTEPRGSLLDPETLLNEMAERFLKAQPVAVHAARTHQQAASIVRKRVKESLFLRYGKDAAALVRPNLEARGRNASHTLDVAIGDGSLMGGVFALSFEVERALDREIKATAFSAEDLRAANPKLPLAVAALPPRDPARDLFFFARDLFPKYGVPLLVDNEIDEWTDKIAGLLAKAPSH